MNETRKSIGLYNRGEIKYVNNISKRTHQQSHQQTTTCKWNPFMMNIFYFTFVVTIERLPLMIK